MVCSEYVGAVESFNMDAETGNSDISTVKENSLQPEMSLDGML